MKRKWNEFNEKILKYYSTPELINNLQGKELELISILVKGSFQGNDKPTIDSPNSYSKGNISFT